MLYYIDNKVYLEVYIVLKFKILGVIIALIYSFFFNIIIYKGDYSVRETKSIESQVRRLNTKEEKAVIVGSVLVEGAKIVVEKLPFFITQRNASQSNFEIIFKVLNPRDKKLKKIKCLAIERYRVLRN